ncbi:MAG: 2-isopropylmalate synthase [Spirochaetaceae bacterium]|nr:2-isopropylmalate synthase [Spirochaetaceae bacterium]
MDHIFIFDTTLRDGEQAPGASMTAEQKYEVALQLSRLGIDIIEAGFPISSPLQFKACEHIAKNLKGPVIAALARAIEKDIDIATEALSSAENSRIHTFIATSPIHMKYKLKKNPDEVIEMAVKAVKYARNKVQQVEFSAEDASRSDLDFLCKVFEKVIDAGATIINVPDTVGYAIPAEIGNIISTIRNNVSNIDKAIISVHCHNDLGLAVANTLAAIENGARQAEVTINGIGERAGNAAFEELIMALDVRKDRMPYKTNINTTQIYNTSRLISNLSGFEIPKNKPIVGENAFAHESGIHQDGVLKHRETYEIMTPASVGKGGGTNLVLGRHSGLHGFKSRVTELGFNLSEEENKNVYKKFLYIADRKKEVYDEDLMTLIIDELGMSNPTYKLEYFNIISGNKAVPTATIKIRHNDEVFEEAATGDGPVDAIFKAIERAIGTTAKLEEYKVQAVTPGKHAMGEVKVLITSNGNSATGRGSSTDILEASANAYVNALNKLLLLKGSNQ